MYVHGIWALAVLQLFLALAVAQSRHDTDRGQVKTNEAPLIVVTELDFSDNSFELSYEIRNDTERDIWIMEGPHSGNISAEAFMDDDSQTLLLRSRLDVPVNSKRPIQGSRPSFDGAYVRVGSGGLLSESISFQTPIRPLFWILAARSNRGLEHATRLEMDIGYYEGDLPGLIRDRLIEEAKVSRKLPLAYPNRPETLFEWYGGLGLLKLNQMNERLRARGDRILLPYTGRVLKGEQSLRMKIGGLRIPYIEELEDPSSTPDLSNLSSLTRIEIRYRPSVLDFYFPYDGVQSLLSHEETSRLRALDTVIVEDTRDVKRIIGEVGKQVRTTAGAVRQRSAVNLLCYDGTKFLQSFPIFNHLTSLGDDRPRLFKRDGGLQSIRDLTPGVRPIELRVRCADNLHDLWHRLRLFHQAEKHRLNESSLLSDVLYPPSEKWCEAMVAAYKSIGMRDYWIEWTYGCPSVPFGKCHYAMNPDCAPDSPAEVVLLFETESGWNQHGGPELFTLDNHDPKGGCVLLNDGTVKFIRTKEELQWLRWK